MRNLISGVFLGVMLLSACGGGGGGGSSGSSASSGSSTTTDAASETSSPSSSSGSSSGGSLALVSANFSSSDAEIPNPERGFYRWIWASSLEALTADDMQDAFSSGYRLVYAPLRLDAYRTTALPDSLLAKLRASFAVARSAGVKLLVRVVYNYPETETAYLNATDAALAQVLAHIGQLKPVFQENGDVMAFVQAGFIGAWGEWHTSSNNLTTVDNRTRIRDALLDAVPTDRFIQMRYPPYIMAWMPNLPGLTATLQGGYRVGMHNDCFLASPTDVGTYSEDSATRATQQSYVAALGQLAPFGGETCDPADDPDPQPRTSCADILGEGARYHLGYLNDEYFRDVFHTRWIANGCMAEVKRKMGYRLQLQSVSHPDTAVAGQAITVNLVVRNTGWARPYNPRTVQIVLRHQSTGAITRIDTSGADPRTWLPDQDNLNALALTLPGSLTVGTYDLFVALPDAASSLRGDARFAIRPANMDNASLGQQWDASLGAFMLGTQLLVR